MKNFLSSILLIATLFSFSNKLCYSQGPDILEQDSLALTMLYRLTDGANWTSSPWIWPPFQSPRYWNGVFVNTRPDNRVRRLILPNNNMVGIIPPEIGNLSACWELNLEANKLKGQIPVQISNMTSLEILSLGNNQLEFPLPNFSSNRKLKTLDLARNNLAREIPFSIGYLGKLEFLNLGKNRFSGTIPETFVELDNLTTLFLNDNLLSGEIPSDILNGMSALIDISLANNDFEGEIPENMGELGNLVALDISGNQLTGTIPGSFEDLEDIVDLNVSKNALSGDLPLGTLGEMASLTNLDLSHNLFGGEIPAEIENLENIEYLILEYNKLEGSIPESLEKLINLKSICSFEGNYLSDIPELAKFPKLQILNISDNRLTFEDIVPNVDIATYVDYAPQRETGTMMTIICEPGDSRDLEWRSGRDDNVYQWLKDGLELTNASGSEYSLEKMAADDEGDYTLQITNPKAPRLTLNTLPLSIKVHKSFIDGFSANADGLELLVLSMMKDIELMRVRQDPIKLLGREILTTGDQLKTSSGGVLLMANSDYSMIMIKESTEVEILAIDSVQSISANRISLDQGEIHASIVDKHSPNGEIHMVSPNALTSSLEEANLGIRYDSESSSTTVVVADGNVNVVPVFSSADSVLLAPWQKVEVTDGGISQVSDFTAKRIEIFRDTIWVPVENKRLFFASVFDDEGNSSSVKVNWQSDGGSFETESNMFYSGNTDGEYIVTATEPIHGLSATAVVIVGEGATGVSSLSQFSENIVLNQNYPNPFTSFTTIDYQLPHSGNVRLKVLNILGEEVAELVSGEKASGKHSVRFNARDLENGTYFYKLQLDEAVAVKKMFLLR